jgi:hypothetical protein
VRARDRKVVLESEALDEDGRLLDGFAKHVRQPVFFRDGVPVQSGVADGGRNILGPEPEERAAMKRDLENAWKETR